MFLLEALRAEVVCSRTCRGRSTQVHILPQPRSGWTGVVALVAGRSHTKTMRQLSRGRSHGLSSSQYTPAHMETKRILSVLPPDGEPEEGNCKSAPRDSTWRKCESPSWRCEQFRWVSARKRTKGLGTLTVNLGLEDLLNLQYYRALLRRPSTRMTSSTILLASPIPASTSSRK